jgi:hypothetical protein
MSRPRAKRACLAVALSLVACGGAVDHPAGGQGGARPITGAGGTSGVATTTTTTTTVGTGGSGTGGAIGTCVAGTQVETLRACLEAGAGPDACVAAVGAPLCDSDGDGLGDDLEAALALAYGPVFAFNGGAFGGNPETDWPANVGHFVAHARLVHRPDGQTETVVDPHPTLATLAQQTFAQGAHLDDDPAAGQGPDFWLCLNDTSPATLVTSSDAMLALPGGIDLEVIAHPANGALDASSHLFVSFGLFFAYNDHSLVDVHEGDRESVELFINRQTGAVDAAWFDRHGTDDDTHFVDAATYGVRSPVGEAPHGDVGSSDASIHGLRFWDDAGPRHHPVAYVGTGGHAMYDYPANTYIVYLGPRDTHDGDGLKLLSWTGDLVPSFTGSGGPKVTVHVENPGEPGHFLLPWAGFRGQWGCTDQLIAKSWPGPYGNARHPRPVLERVWGSPPAP